MDESFKSGFVSLVGLPNAGKSTLINQLAGTQLAITSPKPQTTRFVIQAIMNEPDTQIIFLDTPGFCRPRNKLDQAMQRGIATALADGDIILMITDAAAAARAEKSDRLPRLEQELLERIKKQDKPVVLALNKIDLMAKEALLPIIARYSKEAPFEAIVPISARDGDGIGDLLSEIRRLLKPGPKYYPEETWTDQTERRMVAELIRQQILLLTQEEIPHGVAVDIESFEEIGEPFRERVRISATIYCEKNSHKGILIGKGGSMLKKIGTQAREEIEYLLGCPCYLELFVKVREDWRNRQDVLRHLGFVTRNG